MPERNNDSAKFVTYPGVGPPSPRLNTCLGLSKYWNLCNNLFIDKKKKSSEPGKISACAKCTKRTSHDKFRLSFYLDDKVASFITSTVSRSNAKLRHMRIDCDNQNNENITKSNFTTHLAPCLPPLLGLIKTAKGCVPRRGEICKENFVVSTNG